MKLFKSPWKCLIGKSDGGTANVLSPRCHFSKAQEQTKTKEKWCPAVGLEIHAQINSESKLFSGASTMFGAPVNDCVSFFDCATPGTLPVLNERCVEAGVLTALALSCKVNQVSTFDRKHYFYADLPAGYQITQQRQPLAVDGELGFQVYTPGIHKKPYAKLSKIKQIQLEQDSGKSLHDEGKRRSLIDLNRAGVPLMELVFEPDLMDGEEAVALVKELTAILLRLRTCSCKMEEGALRVDANISVNKPGKPLGIRTEVKNIGTVRAIAGAINYEIERQIVILEKGGQIVNETRAWDAPSRMTVPMRDKEEKQDYRFMPETNLSPLHLHMDESAENTYGLVDVPRLAKQVPELPEETRSKLKQRYDLLAEIIIVLVSEPVLLELFTRVMEEDGKRMAKLVANVLVIEVLTLVNKGSLQLESCKLTPRHIAEMVDLLQSKSINLTTAKRILNQLISIPEDTPKQIVEKNGWFQITDRQELTDICLKTIEQNPKMVEAYKGGKKKVFKALLGQVAKTTNQRAEMSTVTEILQELLER